MKKLYRSEENKMIAGVCGGIGEYFDVDPTLIRVIYVFLSLLTGGFGFPMYLVLWIIIPSKSSVKKDSDEFLKDNKEDMKKTFDTLAKSAKKSFKVDTNRKSK